MTLSVNFDLRASLEAVQETRNKTYHRRQNLLAPGTGAGQYHALTCELVEQWRTEREGCHWIRSRHVSNSNERRRRPSVREVICCCRKEVSEDATVHFCDMPEIVEAREIQKVDDRSLKHAPNAAT